MTDQSEIDLTPSPLRRILWSLVMIALIAGTGYVLWWAYQLKQKAVLDEEEVAAVERHSLASGAKSPDQTPQEEITGEEGADEFVARADTSVEFSSPPAAIEASDAWLRTELPKVNRNPRFNQWLAETNDLLRKAVLLASEVSQGKVPRNAFAFWAPEEPFRARETGDGQYVIDPASYHRYDLLAAAVEAFDMELLWRLYQLAKPLVDQVYAEFAPPGSRFEDTLLKAAEHLLQTPQPRGEIRLVKPSVMYKFADPKLEALSPAQKQLLRMGPVNATIVKRQLGLLRGLLLAGSENRSG